MCNSRQADSTIKGFLYQFEKTLNELLRNANKEDTIITVEGIEDIDTDTNGMQNLLQCKYHENQLHFQKSIIEKPIIQMLEHWCLHQNNSITYKLFCYFPNESERTIHFSINDIEMYLSKDTPKTLKNYKEKIKQCMSANNNNILSEFVNRLSIEFGKSYDYLQKCNIDLLNQLKFNKDIISEIFHPNALAIIHCLSVKKDIKERKISVKDFISQLKKLDKVLLWKYSKFLSNYKLILKKKRDYLKENLKKNIRIRYFVFDKNSFDNITNTLIIFINEYIETFHYKKSKLHLSNLNIPIFIIVGCDYKSFQNIFNGLLNKDIKPNIGFTFHPNNWTEKEFYQEAVIKNNNMSFNIRLLLVTENQIKKIKDVISRHNIDDLFIINTSAFQDINIQGCNKEVIQVNNIRELKYVLNMVKDYE